jgi:hypothetical protein
LCVAVLRKCFYQGQGIMKISCGEFALFTICFMQQLSVALSVFTYNGWTVSDDFPTWVACPVVVPPILSPPEGMVAENMKCLKFDVPRDWNDIGNGETISSYNLMYKGSGASQYGIWYLAGGPGNSAVNFLDDGPFASMVKEAAGTADAEAVNKINFYANNHRGTGWDVTDVFQCMSMTSESSPGGAMVTVQEFPSCVNDLEATYGIDGMAAISTTNAAQDVRFLMNWEMNNPNYISAPLKNTVYGESYGTYWGQRVMQLEAQNSIGKIFDNFILDGVVAPDMYIFPNQVESFTSSVRIICDACAENYGGCRKVLGNNLCDESFPLLLRKLDQGHCAESGIDKRKMQQMLGLFISVAQWPLTATTMIQRLWRCSADDVVVLKRLDKIMTTLLAPALVGAFTGTASQAVLFNVYVGESQAPPQQPTPTWLTNVGLVKDRGAYAQFWPEGNVSYAWSVWPKYNDPLSGQYPTTFDRPLMLLNGGLDANTPISYAFHAYQKYTQLYKDSGAHINLAPKLLFYPAGKHVISSKLKQARAAILAFIQDQASTKLQFNNEEYVFKGIGQVSDIFNDPQGYYLSGSDTAGTDLNLALTHTQFTKYVDALKGTVTMTKGELIAMIWSTDLPMPSMSYTGGSDTPINNIAGNNCPPEGDNATTTMVVVNLSTALLGLTVGYLFNKSKGGAATSAENTAATTVNTHGSTNPINHCSL